MFFIKTERDNLTEEETILESQIQRQILDYLKSIDVDSWRQNNNGIPWRRFTGLHGVHDILGFFKPKHFPIALFMTIEVKIPGKDMSEDQKNFAHMVRKNGHISFTARCVADVQYAFTRLNTYTWGQWLNFMHENFKIPLAI